MKHRRTTGSQPANEIKGNSSLLLTCSCSIQFIQTTAGKQHIVNILYPASSQHCRSFCFSHKRRVLLLPAGSLLTINIGHHRTVDWYATSCVGSLCYGIRPWCRLVNHLHSDVYANDGTNTDFVYKQNKIHFIQFIYRKLGNHTSRPGVPIPLRQDWGQTFYSLYYILNNHSQRASLTYCHII